MLELIGDEGDAELEAELAQGLETLETRVAGLRTEQLLAGET